MEINGKTGDVPRDLETTIPYLEELARLWRGQSTYEQHISKRA